MAELTERTDNAADSPGQRWGKTVRDERAQADRVRTDDPNADHWRNLAHRFAPATREQAFSDETFTAVREHVSASDSVLDVGAGAGRLAIPLADICSHVTAVEPSKAMLARLKEQARAWGLSNIDIVESTWEDAEVQQADVVVCAHVIYTVQDIKGFLSKLTAAAKREVIVVVFEEPAMANYFPLWKSVYGEERISLPSLNELKLVLDEMGVGFSVTPLPEWESRPFTDAEGAFEESLARLFISRQYGDADVIDRLRKALGSSLVPVDGGLRFKWAKPHRPHIVRWTV